MIIQDVVLQICFGYYYANLDAPSGLLMPELYPNCSIYGLCEGGFGEFCPLRNLLK